MVHLSQFGKGCLVDFGHHPGPLSSHQQIEGEDFFLDFFHIFVAFVVNGACQCVHGNAFTAALDFNAHAFVLDHFIPEITTVFMGHEETHILEDIGKLNVLENRLSKIGIQNSNFSNQEGEFIADVGGFYAFFIHYPDSDYHFPNGYKKVVEWYESKGIKGFFKLKERA